MTRMAISERLATSSFFCRVGWGDAGAAPFTGDDGGRGERETLAIREGSFYAMLCASCESGDRRKRRERPVSWEIPSALTIRKPGVEKRATAGRRCAWRR